MSRSCEKDVKVRVGKAAAVFGKMRKTATLTLTLTLITATLTGYSTSQMAEEHTGHLLERQDNKH